MKIYQYFKKCYKCYYVDPANLLQFLLCHLKDNKVTFLTELKSWYINYIRNVLLGGGKFSLFIYPSIPTQHMLLKFLYCIYIISETMQTFNNLNSTNKILLINMSISFKQFFSFSVTTRSSFKYYSCQENVGI